MAFENAYTLNDCLPVEPDSSVSEYLQDLWKTFDANCEANSYSFAYIVLHMIFMSYIYFALCKIRNYCKDRFNVAISFTVNNKDSRATLLPTENTAADEQYFFGNFGLLPESEVFRLFEFVGMDASLLNELRKQVQRRNDIAHVRGRIVITTAEEFERDIDNYVNLCEKIHYMMKPIIQKQYAEFLIESQDRETRPGSADDEEQVLEYWVRANHLSKKEINTCRQYRFNTLQDQPNYDTIRSLAAILADYYMSLSDDIEEPALPA